MPKENRHAYFHEFPDIFNRYDEFLDINSDLTPIEIALEYALQHEEIDTIICGVNNLKQLKEIVKVYKKHYNNGYQIDFSDFCGTDDVGIVDPSKWRIHDKNRDNWTK